MEVADSLSPHGWSQATCGLVGPSLICFERQLPPLAPDGHLQQSVGVLISSCALAELLRKTSPWKNSVHLR